jgi:Holliday junction resolvase RusA-like endonuclease
VREAASTVMQDLGREPLPSKTPIECLMLMVLPIPDSWPQRKKEAAARGEILPTVTPDISNMLKLAEDALKHVVWNDDKDVVNGIQRKIYGWAPLIKIIVRKARPLAELRRLEDIRTRDDNLVGQDEETVGPLFVDGAAA